MTTTTPSSSSSTGSVSLAATLSPRTLPPLAPLNIPASAPSPDATTAELLSLLAHYADRLAVLEQHPALATPHPSSLLTRRAADGSYDPEKYRHLGKPVGGTFIAVALVFLLLGEWTFIGCRPTG